jgi:hypothetical protein
MGEPIWTTFHIKTPPGWQSAEITPSAEPHRWFDAGVTLDNYLGDQEILDLDDGSLHWTWQGEANYGLSADTIQYAIDWCDKHRVPYEVYDESKYDMEGSIVMSDGFTYQTRSCDNTGVITLSQYRYKSICNQYQDFGMRWLAIEEHFAPANFDLNECSVAHLPAWPPPDPDDALSFDECEEAGVDGTLREVG